LQLNTIKAINYSRKRLVCRIPNSFCGCKPRLLVRLFKRLLLLLKVRLLDSVIAVLRRCSVDILVIVTVVAVFVVRSRSVLLAKYLNCCLRLICMT